jgi:hypothetical protein
MVLYSSRFRPFKLFASSQGKSRADIAPKVGLLSKAALYYSSITSNYPRYYEKTSFSIRKNLCVIFGLIPIWVVMMLWH